MGGFYSEVAVDKNKKPTDVTWKSCVKMMKNPDEFLKKLIDHKNIIDQNLVPTANMKYIKENYLSMESFRPDVMANKSMAAKGLCEWCMNMYAYWAVI